MLPTPFSNGSPSDKLAQKDVLAYFDATDVVADYARAAYWVGLWDSERQWLRRIFNPRERLLEMGCGAGRVSAGLWRMGYRHLVGVDLSAEMVDKARAVAAGFAIPPSELSFQQGDATRLSGFDDASFDGAIFAFNGLMQIPGRDCRRAALRELARVVRRGGHLFFTTHDRANPFFAEFWRDEQARWASGNQDRRLCDFGDRYYDSPLGHVFMHVPDRAEILEDLALCQWRHCEDLSRCEVADEPLPVREFSDECRLWHAERV